MSEKEIADALLAMGPRPIGHTLCPIAEELKAVIIRGDRVVDEMMIEVGESVHYVFDHEEVYINGVKRSVMKIDPPAQQPESAPVKFREWT